MNSEDSAHEEVLFRFLISISGLPLPEPAGKDAPP